MGWRGKCGNEGWGVGDLGVGNIIFGLEKGGWDIGFPGAWGPMLRSLKESD